MTTTTTDTTDYEFTQDWFHWAPEVWQQLVPHLPEGETFGTADYGIRHFLEIGSFEGRSAVWIMQHMMRAYDTITCIDTWQGGEEHSAEDVWGIEDRFDTNIAIAKERFAHRDVHKRRGFSDAILAEEREFGLGKYAFIYIDGSHIAKDVLTDACMAWPLLQKGGLMVFDDYLWAPSPRDILHRPKIAIDAFVNIFAEELQVVHSGYQLIIRKV